MPILGGILYRFPHFSGVFSFVDNEVYSWGNNAMGQCGLGHTNSPVTTPIRISALSKLNVNQISAGTSHSIAWTALPLDRYVRKYKVAVCTCDNVLVLSLL